MSTFLFDHSGFSQKCWCLAAVLVVVFTLVHAFFFVWVDYGKFSLDGTVFCFIGEFVWQRQVTALHIER